MSIDERIESAGARLATTPVAVPEFERLVRRRSRRVRINAVVGSVVVISIGVAALVRYEGSTEQVAAKSVVPTDDRAGDATAGYNLALEGVRLVDDSTSTARGGPNAVWFDETTGTYLTVAVLQGEATVSGGQPTGLAPMVEDTTFPSTRGRAWFTSISSNSIKRMTMWWSRPDGDVWLLDSLWYGDRPVNAPEARDTLRNWALAIAAPDPQGAQQHYELADPSMRRVADDQGGDVEYRVQSWAYQDEHIFLSSTQDSVATSVIAVLTRGQPELVRVDGHDAWQVTDSTTGEILIGWQTTATHPAWVALTIPAALAALASQIRAALHAA
jgi:hypothetical protein